MVYNSVSKIDEIVTFREFVGGKARRIIPLLAISVFVETILRYVGGLLAGNSEFSYNLLDIAVNAAGLQTIGLFETNSINQPTWYLSVLLLCYLWLFIITKVSKRLKFNSCYGYVFMVILGIVINTYSWNTIFLNRSVSRGYFSFFVGLLIAHYFVKVKRNRGELVSFIFPIIFFILLITKPHFLTAGDFYFYTLMLWIPILILAVRWIPTQRDCRVITFLGKASFSVYIWNEPMSCLRDIVATLFTVDLCSMSALMIFVFSNWFIGVCSYLLIEKPINKWLKRETMRMERNVRD